jgi:hypothetical protein
VTNTGAQCRARLARKLVRFDEPIGRIPDDSDILPSRLSKNRYSLRRSRKVLVCFDPDLNGLRFSSVSELSNAI